MESSTTIAEIMVKKLGMSEKLGLRVIRSESGAFGGQQNQELGPETAELIDAEINRYLSESYK